MKFQKHKQKKHKQKEDGIKHIAELFHQAEIRHSKEHKLSDRYVEIALKIRDKLKVPLTKKQKMMFCKNCHAYLVPGENCKVRTKNKMLLYHCEKCGDIRKFILK